MGTPPVPLQVINNHHRDDILDRDNILDLPPGFRFHPTDEEIITCYLREKVMDRRFTALAVAEVDLNKSEPWDLPAKATMGEKEWYFFCQRDRKYPTGMRTNRATESGYWKATGKDKEIYKGGKGKSCLIGMKKTLVFYKGRAPKGEKTNWVMHEYRLDGKLSLHRAAMEEWVICRVFHKNTGLLLRREPLLLDSFVDDLLENPNYTLPSLIEMPVSSSTPSTSTYPDDHHDVDFFNNNNNYYYKQQDHDELLLIPKQEKEKSFDHQTLLSVPNSEFSEFRNYPYNITSTTNDGFKLETSHQHQHQHQQQHQQQQLSSNNSMISDNNTGLMMSSTDVANEINSSIQGFDDSTKHFEDLDSLWNYY